MTRSLPEPRQQAYDWLAKARQDCGLNSKEGKMEIMDYDSPDDPIYNSKGLHLRKHNASKTIHRVAAGFREGDVRGLPGFATAQKLYPCQQHSSGRRIDLNPQPYTPNLKP